MVNAVEYTMVQTANLKAGAYVWVTISDRLGLNKVQGAELKDKFSRKVQVHAQKVFRVRNNLPENKYIFAGY